jgi:hypothetical protein
MSGLLEKLKEKEKTNNYAVKYWKPNPGDVIEGTVDDIGTTITSMGDSNYIQIIDSSGEKHLIFLNSVLKRLANEEDVQKGDRIAIKFTGLVESKKYKNRRFKNYILVKE